MFGHAPPSHVPRTQPSAPPPPPFGSPPLPSARPSRGGFSAPFSPVSPPLHVKASRGWFHGVSTPFMPPPPPLHTSSSRRRTFRVFPRRSHLFHLPRMQEQAGGERSWPFDAASASYISLPTRLSRMWTFMALWRCPRLLHPPRTQGRTGGGFMVCNSLGSSARI